MRNLTGWSLLLCFATFCVAGCAQRDYAAHARSQDAWLEATDGTFSGGPRDDYPFYPNAAIQSATLRN